jgi:hypothetical protein
MVVEMLSRGFACLAVALALAGTAQASGENRMRLQPLRDDCVQIWVSTDTRVLTRGQRLALSSSFVPGGDMSYMGPRGGEDDPDAIAYLSMSFWLEEKGEGIGRVAQVTTRAPHEWEGSVRIDWRGADYFRQSFEPGEGTARLIFETWQKHEQIAKERQARLKWVVVPDAESTVGDALQTAVDLLGVEVRVMPKLAETYAPDWEKLLDVPLNATDAQRRDGLSLGGLIHHVAQRLGGVPVIDGDVLSVEDEETAAKHLKEHEEVARRWKGTALDSFVGDILPIPEEKDPQDADQEQGPAQHEADRPAVAPE